MRVAAALLFALTACHAAKASGPAWPAASTTADDGGESIEPRPTAVAAAVETSEDETPAEPTVVAEEPAVTAAPAETPAPAPTDSQPQGEVIMSDEIIIEIDDE